MAKDKAKVAIVDPSSGTKAHVILPINVTTKQMLPHLVKALKMPPEGPGGAPMQYHLTLETDEGRVRLEEDEMLAEAGIQDGAVLRITPDMTAGVQGGV